MMHLESQCAYMREFGRILKYTPANPHQTPSCVCISLGYVSRHSIFDIINFL